MAEYTNDPAQGYADISSLLGAYSTSKKQDRHVVGNQTQSYDQIMLDAQKARENAESDALRKLSTTGYILGGGAPYKPASFQMQGKQTTLPTFGFGPKAPSQAQTQGAAVLQNQLLQRLGPNGSYTPTNVEEYTKPGVGERIGDIAGLVTGGLGAYKTITGGASIPGLGFLDKIPGLGGGAANAASAGVNAAGLTAGQNASGINSLGWTLPSAQGTGGAGSTVAGILGKAAPIAGIATGAMGLMKDRGWAGNMASGASTGAGIGSMVAPGIGTAIGAGVGALGGLLRGIGGGPSKEELAGREFAGQGRQGIAALAQPQQVAEAQNAGWADPQSALVHIILRDRFGEQAASQIENSLWQAEKQGPEAVGRILQMLDSRRG